MTQENTAAPDEATQWYQELKQSALRNVDAQLDQLSQGHAALETAYNGLDARSEAAHDSLDTRQLIEIERERSRLLSEAAQIQNGYQALQAEKQRLEQHQDPRFDELLSNSSAPGQMFLRVHRHQLENDPAKLRQLLHADARCRAVGLKPDSKQYFSALETAVGLETADRRTDDFFESDKTSDRPAKQEQRKETLSAEQLRFCKDSGIPEESYRAYAQNPFSQASATVEVEPADFNTGADKSMEVSLDEPAKKPAVDASRYRPGPSTVTLSPVEKDICMNMASVTGRPVNEVLKDFAKQKLALHSGKAPGYQLYADKMRSEGRA